MLKPYKVVDTVKMSILAQYKVGELVIHKQENFQIYAYKKTLEKEWLFNLSVEELRYCCSFSPALIQAVWDYYDYAEPEDIEFVSIIRILDLNELISEFNNYCLLAITESNNLKEKLDAIEDYTDMLKNELNIYRIASKILFCEVE